MPSRCGDPPRYRTTKSEYRFVGPILVDPVTGIFPGPRVCGDRGERLSIRHGDNALDVGQPKRTYAPPRARVTPDVEHTVMQPYLPWLEIVDDGLVSPRAA